MIKGVPRPTRQGDSLVLFELLVFAGSGSALHEEELRAQQTDAVAAQFRHFAGVLESSNIGGDLDVAAVGGRGRLEGMGEIFLALRFVADLRLAQLLSSPPGRIQPQRALAAVKDHGRAIGELQSARLDAGERRECPGSAPGWPRGRSRRPAPSQNP